jgi:hypothetical protein
VVVIYPATLVQHVGRRDEIRDERALVFFLYDAGRGAPLLEAFGHPEWGNGRGAAETVLTLEPLAWLRIEGDPHAYLFVMRQRGAEKLDWAILDLATGRPALRTP